MEFHGVKHKTYQPVYRGKHVDMNTPYPPLIYWKFRGEPWQWQDPHPAEHIGFIH